MQAPAHAAHASVVGTFFAWLIALASTAEPIISSVCGLLGIVSACYAIAWYRKRLGDKQEPPP